jgi:hypothetical protein
MSVDVDIIIQSTKDALSVPSFATFDDKEGKEYVYVIEDGKAKKLEVKKGARGIERTEIVEGLEEGQEIILSLEAKGLRDGKKVKLREKEEDDEDGAADDEAAGPDEGAAEPAEAEAEEGGKAAQEGGEVEPSATEDVEAGGTGDEATS